MAPRRAVVLLLLALAATASVVEIAYLIVVSRPGFRSWLKGELERNGGGVFSFGPIGGSPLRVGLADVAFESRGSSNVKRLHAPVAHVAIDWLPLIRERRVALRSMTLEGAQVEIRLEGGRPEQVALPVAARRVELRASVVRVFKLSGWTVFLAGVNASLRQSGAGNSLAVGATLESSRVMLGDLVLQDAMGSVRLGNGQLELLALEATLYGGSLKASGSLLLDPPQSLPRVDLVVSGIDVLAALRGLRYSERFGGKARLEASFTGRLAPALRNLTGRGRLGVERFTARADLPRINLFNVAPVLSELKRVESLAGGAQLLLSGQKVELADLTLERPDLRITGSGYLTLAGGLSADCRAFLRGELAKGVPPMVRSSLESTGSGELIVPFKVGSTLAEPRVDIGAVVTGALLHPFKKVFD